MTIIACRTTVDSLSMIYLFTLFEFWLEAAIFSRPRRPEENITLRICIIIYLRLSHWSTTITMGNQWTSLLFCLLEILPWLLVLTAFEKKLTSIFGKLWKTLGIGRSVRILQFTPSLNSFRFEYSIITYRNFESRHDWAQLSFASLKMAVPRVQRKKKWCFAIRSFAQSEDNDFFLCFTHFGGQN